MPALRTFDGIAYREDGPAHGAPVLLLHGFPESSYMWRDLIPAIAATGRRAIAPDFPGYGDSAPDPPGTWERHVEALERFRRGLGIERAALVMHDWGGLIGLRWACEHPEAVESLVLSNTGFFPDGKWHGMAQVMRSEQGEELIDNLTREAFFAMIGDSSPGITDDALAEYWKGLATPERRRGAIELYRSGDFEKIAACDGCLASMEVPALVLWGAKDEFAPVAGAYRFRKELRNPELVVLEDAGHFVFEDEPERCAEAGTGFLPGR